MTETQSLDDKRVTIVNEHMRLENAYDFPGCILFARVPPPSTHAYIPSHWEVGAVIGVNFALVLFEWVTIRKYTDSLLASSGTPQKVTAAHY